MPTRFPRAPIGPSARGPRLFRSKRPYGATSAPPPAPSIVRSSTTLQSWMVQLDMRLVVQGVYNTTTSLTTFTTPCPFFGTTAVSLATGDSFPLTKVNDTTFSVPADFSAGLCVLGTPAPFQVDLSEVVARDANDKPEIDLGVLVKYVTILHRKMTGFSVTVTHARDDLWPTETYSWAKNLTIAADSVYGRLRVRVATLAERSTISIAEATWKPVSIAGLEHDLEVLELNR